jgi:catechol 2,3-dioxygenase-like lactoylglutathione lyase family enzyme
MDDSPKFLSAVPVLPALDIAETIAFYKEHLGFVPDFQSEDYAGLSRGSVQIHVWLCNDRQIAENSSCRINVRGIEHLYQEYQAQNVIHPNGSSTTKPWGLKEFTVLDSNGNCITFAETPAPGNRRDRTD